MRITNKMLYEDVQRELQANASRLSRSREQVTTMRRLNRPSDDPSQTRTAVKLRDALAELDQFMRNIDIAERTLSSTDAALDSAGEIVQRAREVAIQGANGSLSPLDRQQIAVVVEALVDGLVQQTQAKSGGSYLFSGFRTDTPPYTTATGAYLGDSGAIMARPVPNTTVQINIKADVAFAPALAALVSLQAELAAGMPVSGATIAALDGGLDALITARGLTGARQNRLAEARANLDDVVFASRTLLSGLEDADMTQAISDLIQREATYEAAIRVNARVLQMTLLDVLR